LTTKDEGFNMYTIWSSSC